MSGIEILSVVLAVAAGVVLVVNVRLARENRRRQAEHEAWRLERSKRHENREPR